MKIGISCYPTYGGSGIVATELAMALAEAGDEVHVISYALPSRLTFSSSRIYFHEVVVPRYPLFEYPPYSLALATKMVEVARHQKLDVMHVHYAVPNAVSAVLARQILAPQPLPVVTTLHGTDVTLVGNDPNYLETTRYGIVQSDAVTAVSESLRLQTVEQLGVLTKTIHVVPNFIDPGRFEAVRGTEGARRWAKPGERTLVHISNFRPVKRVLDVVEIFERVHREVPSRLILVGDGPERGKVEQVCRERDLCHAITFIGSLPLIEEILVGADLFLLPSETESFGLAALEAMSCEVPVIATTAGGLPEVVVDGETGYLRAVGDVDGMAKAALDLLSDEPKRLAFAAAGRKLAVERFAQDVIVSRYRELYLRVVAGANS
ncbi:MAG TPA: N-acetyl-alpha-D-glucosaminyl L-malate synthase BshA [Thermoanaerobaculia bacterium]|nr:N-acetyl-alpha-D-glucosaminyl L-malate synthase BshA [Thermoanaerobaculia bacterium]